MINRHGCEILGYDAPRDIIGLPWFDTFLPPRLRDEVRDIFQRVFAGEQAHRESYTAPVLRRSGEERLILWRTAILKDENGRIIESLSSGEDITERERAAEELRQTNELLSTVIEAAPMAIYAVDMRDRITLWNPAVETIYGLSAADALGRSWRDTAEGRIPPDTSSSADLIDTALTQGGFRDLEVRRIARDGVVRDLSVSAALLRDPSDAVSGILFVAHDISQTKEMERKLRQSQRMEAIGQLTGGIAHDFNNLLAIIHGNLELLAEQLGSDPLSREMIGDALKAATRGAALTHRLLAFSRQQQLAPTPVDIGALLADMTGMLRRTVQESIEIGTNVAPDLWTSLIDAQQLENALLNLVVNARDAMPDGGALTITAENATIDEDYAHHYAEVVAGRYIKLSVTDTGAGMTKEILDRALEPFFTTKPVGRGTGLGLSMVYGFVKQSGGHFTLYSEPGLGATASLYLPESGSEPVMGPIAEGTVPGASEERVILLVEDNASLRKIQIRMLNSLGYQTLEAADGPAGLAVLESGARVDLLLTDVVMPGGMSGYALAEAARRNRPSLRIILMSGYAPNGRPHTDDLADTQYLLKPFTRSALATAVQAEFEKRKAQ
jgi:PAS domain S-box-containing protein